VLSQTIADLVEPRVRTAIVELAQGAPLAPIEPMTRGINYGSTMLRRNCALANVRKSVAPRLGD
jgi:hypothetical protein